MDQDVNTFFNAMIADFKLENVQNDQSKFSIKNHQLSRMEVGGILDKFNITKEWAFQGIGAGHSHAIPEQSHQQDLAYHI